MTEVKMSDDTISTVLTPSVTYDEAREGIRWLVDVLGFEVASAYEDPNGRIAFAELFWRTGIVFVSQKSQQEPWSGAGPASIALAAENAAEVDRHYERALASSADIVRALHDSITPAFPLGSHQFDVRDPGGNLWTIGTFQPRISRSGSSAFRQNKTRDLLGRPRQA
jgi:uncharacterized glyoxalase superfamily protein PhnB